MKTINAFVRTVLFFCPFVFVITSLADDLIVRATPAGGAIALTWNSQSNGFYRVLSRPLSDLGGFWNDVSPPIYSGGLSTGTNIPAAIGESGRLFGVLSDQEGTAILLPPGMPLVWDDTELLVIARPAPGDPPIEMISLFEVTDDGTNLLASVGGTNLTEARFSFDSAFLANGPRRLMAMAYAENDTNNPAADSSAAYASTERSVIVTNGIYFPEGSPTTIGWKLVTTFGTLAPSGTYGVDVWAYSAELDDWWQYAQVTGDLSERDADGWITVEDSYIWDDSIPGYRPRDPYDSYPAEGIDDFYVEITVTNASYVLAARTPYPPPPKPTGPPPRPIYRKPFAGSTATRWVTRLSSIVEDRNTLNLNEDSIDRQLLDGMVEVMYLSLAYVSWHWNFTTLQYNGNQFPGDGGWNKLTGPPEWRRFAYALARRYSPGGYPVNPTPLITHVFSFTHGGPKGLYSGLGGTGLGASVTPMIINAMGFQKTNGLTYAFFDACEVFADGAALPNLLLVNGGTTGKISLADLIKKGLFPHYACGWSSTKYIGFAGGRVNTDHVGYITAYAGYLFDPDPATGWPRFTYEEVRARAVKLPGTLDDRPTAKLNWEHVGCKECKVYY